MLLAEGQLKSGIPAGAIQFPIAGNCSIQLPLASVAMRGENSDRRRNLIGKRVAWAIIIINPPKGVRNAKETCCPGIGSVYSHPWPDDVLGRPKKSAGPAERVAVCRLSERG